MKKAIDVLIFLVFALFAYFQLNDPDSLRWALVYGLPAILAAMALKGIYPMKVYYAFLLFYIVLILTYVPHLVDWFQRGMPNIASSMKAESPYIELTREFFGLVLCLISVVYYIWRAKK